MLNMLVRKIQMNKKTKLNLSSLLLASVITLPLWSLPITAQADTWQEIKDGTAQGWEKTKEIASDLTESTKAVVNDEDNQETAKAIWSNVKTDASRAWEATKEGASVVSEKVVETSKEGLEKAKELAE